MKSHENYGYKKIAEDLSKQLKSRNDTYDHFFVADLKGNYISSNGTNHQP